MKPELEKLLNLKNKDFIEKAIERLQKLSLTDDDLLILSNISRLNDTIAKNYSYTYPILKEVSQYGEVIKDFTHVKGNRRYFSEKFYINGKYFILCNDWYYPSENKKNVKDTRTPFLEWVEHLESVR